MGNVANRAAKRINRAPQEPASYKAASNYFYRKVSTKLSAQDNAQRLDQKHAALAVLLDPSKAAVAERAKDYFSRHSDYCVEKKRWDAHQAAVRTSVYVASKVMLPAKPFPKPWPQP